MQSIDCNELTGELLGAMVIQKAIIFYLYYYLICIWSFWIIKINKGQYFFSMIIIISINISIIISNGVLTFTKFVMLLGVCICVLCSAETAAV